jgi:hypothetical protein
MAIDPHHRAEGSVPQNPRLWEMLVAQAKQKYPTYPSLPASKWIHAEYVKRGGIFVDSKKKDTRHDLHGRQTRAGKKEEEQKEQAKGKKKAKD